jgi:ATP-dependent Lon protease
MGNLDDLTRLPEGFDGTVRLFPLPSLVLFPHAMQPLHIFEPRYCEMLAEALATDDLITMATLTGDPPAPKTEPPINRTVCVGRIFSHVPQEDDRHNILLVGIKRARVVSEIDAGRCFRIAKVNVLDDVYPPDGNQRRGQLRRDLLQTFAEVIPSTASGQQSLNELLAGSTGLGPITDIISFRLPLPVELKLRLLGESNVDRRAQQLINFLRSSGLNLKAADESATGKTERLPFPPPFSAN